jgi:hypothetical protein
MNSRFVSLLAFVLVLIIGCQQTQGPMELGRHPSGDPAALEQGATGDPPVIVVAGRYFLPRTVSGIDGPLWSIDLPAGKPTTFCWAVIGPNAGHEYRYGWDILDLNDDELWETAFAPFAGNEACSPPRTFFFGTHTFHVEVVDPNGQRSRAGIRINIVPEFAEAIMDIRPHLCPNPLVVRSRGLVRVALLGTPELDVNTVVPETLRMAGATPIRTAIRDIAAPSSDGGECVCSEAEPDGLDDMILTFRSGDLGQPTPAPWHSRWASRLEVVLFLWGSTGGPLDFVASDCVLVPDPFRGGRWPRDRVGDALTK